MSLIKVKSCIVLLRTLLVCIRNYLISVLREKYLILGTYHQDSGVLGNCDRWGVQKIQLRTEDRDLGAVAP